MDDNLRFNEATGMWEVIDPMTGKVLRTVAEPTFGAPQPLRIPEAEKPAPTILPTEWPSKDRAKPGLLTPGTNFENPLEPGVLDAFEKTGTPTLADYVTTEQDASDELEPNFGENEVMASDLAHSREQLDQGYEQVNQAHEDKLGKLALIRAITEGLGQVGQGLSAYGGGDLPPAAYSRPYTRGLDFTEEQEMDRLMPGERKMLGEGLGITIPEGATASRMTQFAGPLSQASARQAAAETQAARLQGTNERFNINQKTRIRSELARATDQFGSAPGVKDTRDQSIAAMKGLAALEDNTPTGDMAALTNALRASGEKGAMSDQDMARWLYRMGWIDKVEDWFSMKMGGRLSEAKRNEVKSVLHRYQQVSINEVRKRAQLWASRKARTYQVDEDELLNEILLPEETDEGTSETVDMVKPGGKVIPGIHRTQIERFQAKYPGSVPR